MKKSDVQLILFLSLALISFTGCEKGNESEQPQQNQDFQLGKNRFTIDIAGDTREYFVHVPNGYNDQIETAVVFMLHGTSGNGEKFYNISGWKEVGEAENILTVFPSSWHHSVSEEGRPFKNTTKWNVYSGSFTYNVGEVPRDDIQFLKEILKAMNQAFNIDSKRLYMVGFSNGGAMAFRCAVEMSDIFAAFVEASGTIQVDTLLNPKRDPPIFFQTGNSDDKFLRNNSDIPLTSIDSLLQSPGLKPIMNTHLNSFRFDSAYASTISPLVAQAYFNPNPNIKGNRHLLFVLIEGLEHSYPNGKNHPLKGAVEHWKWLKGFSLK